MTRAQPRTARRSLVIALAAIIGTSLSITLGFATGANAKRAREQANDSAADAPTEATPYIFGARYCAKCHGETEAEAGPCRMIEATIWQASDPHRDALAWGRNPDGSFLSAAGERAASIGQNLGITDVTTSERCVGCHSLKVGDPTLQQSFKPASEGVTCVACHGAYDPWVTEHQVINKLPWKTASREQKWLRYGMVDLWDPVTRARTCVSCHVGDPDPAAAKRLTHDIYAAGHPPLPGFELASFSQLEPQHWLDERCEFEQGRTAAPFDKRRVETAEHVIATGLVVAQRSLELMAAESINDSAWPDFAQFDCRACHHELKQLNAHSSEPLPSTAPGRPVWPRWTFALAIPSVQTLGDTINAGDFRRLVNEFEDRIARQPFAVSAASTDSADALVRSIDGSIRALRASLAAQPPNTPIDRAATLKLLRGIVAQGARLPVDFESARQLGWATQALWHSYQQEENDPSATTASVNQEIAKLDALLSLTLRTDLPRVECPTDRPFANQPTDLIGPRLNQRLAHASDYDATAVREAFETLRDLLPRE